MGFLTRRQPSVGDRIATPGTVENQLALCGLRFVGELMGGLVQRWSAQTNIEQQAEERRGRTELRKGRKARRRQALETAAEIRKLLETQKDRLNDEEFQQWMGRYEEALRAAGGGGRSSSTSGATGSRSSRSV